MTSLIQQIRSFESPKVASDALLGNLNALGGNDVYMETLDKLGSISVTNLDGRIVHVNAEFLRMSGYEAREVIGRTHAFLKSGFHPREFYDDMHRVIAAGEVWRAPVQNRAKDGALFWTDAIIVPLRKHKAITGYFSFQIDVTAAVSSHIELQSYSKLMKAMLTSFPGGVAVYDENLQMVACNEMLKQLLGYPPKLFDGALPTLETLLRWNAELGEYGEGDIEEQVASRLELAKRNVAHIYERQRPNGLCLEVRGTPLEAGGFVSTHLDITQRKLDQETIARLARHDALTDLPNRVLLQDRMEKALARVRRGDTLALLCLDLDHFKPVNDLLGHPVGDLLLQAVAKRLEGCVREMDTVARLGGDEFAILLQGVGRPEDAEVVARRVIDTVSKPYKIGDHTITVSASAGISMAPNDTVDAAQLMINGDLALYRSKSAGRGKYSFFEPSMQARVHSRHVIQNGLLDALTNDGFKLHYQPIVRASDRRVVSCEALIRWSHPERGLISAADFIPIAEEFGLIGRIGEWVLRTACREAKSWPEHVSVAVNISAAQLRGGDLEKTVLSALDGLKPSRLLLEITESLLMQNSHATSETLKRLRDIGVRFALDDFGTGYSSLSYLQSFPFDTLKVDRSFISGGGDEQRSATLRRAIFQLGKSLGMTTVAEGVETEEQFARLKEEDCILAQGFLVSRAVPRDQLGKFFQ